MYGILLWSGILLYIFNLVVFCHVCMWFAPHLVWVHIWKPLSSTFIQMFKMCCFIRRVVIKSKAISLIFISSAGEASGETKIHRIPRFRYRLSPPQEYTQTRASFLPNTKRILMKLENFLLTKVSLESEGFGRPERRLISQGVASSRSLAQRVSAQGQPETQ